MLVEWSFARIATGVIKSGPLLLTLLLMFPLIVPLPLPLVIVGSLKVPRGFCHPEAYPGGTSPGDGVSLIATKKAVRKCVGGAGWAGGPHLLLA